MGIPASLDLITKCVIKLKKKILFFILVAFTFIYHPITQTDQLFIHVRTFLSHFCCSNASLIFIGQPSYWLICELHCKCFLIWHLSLILLRMFSFFNLSFHFCIDFWFMSHRLKELYTEVIKEFAVFTSNNFMALFLFLNLGVLLKNKIYM